MKGKSNNLNFDAMTINKFFKDQQQVKTINKQFTDPMFPPNINSILAKDINGKWIGTDSKKEDIDTKKLEWRSAKEIFGENFSLFEGKIECDDIKQGSLGNCYFLSALSSLSEFPDLIKRIFRTEKVNKFGYYELVFNIEGEWQVVIIDDFFPVTVSKEGINFKFARPNGKEIWVILLEKAWAKINGGYRNTIAGKATDVLNVITGFPSDSYHIISQVMKEEKLLEIIKHSDENNNLMCATTNSDKSLKELGLVTLHVYTLIGINLLNVRGKKIYLVKLRNPWGKLEWNGDWSDSSSMWSSELKSQIGYVNKDDGTFYMNISDFQKYYTHISICSFMLDSKFKMVKYNTSKLDPFPQVLNLQIIEKSNFSISCIDRHYRFTREICDYLNNCYVIICKYFDNTIEHIESDFNTNSSVDLILNLEKGNYLIWVWNDFDHSLNILNKKGEKEIKLTFSCNKDFYIKKNSKDKEFKLLKYIIYQNIDQNNNIKDKDFLSFSGNMFHNSGISYKLLINNYKDKKLVTNHEYSGLENCCLMEKYPNEIIVESVDWDIILGCRSNYIGTYWFNIKSKIKTSSEESLNIRKNSQFSNIFDIFCITNFKNNSNFNYDYITKIESGIICNDSKGLNEKSSEKLINSNTNIIKVTNQVKNNDKKNNLNGKSSIKLSQLKEKYPTEMSMLLKEFNNVSKEFNWIEKFHDNALYLGQINNKNERHGLGIYMLKNNSGYYGNWENNKKNGVGVAYIDNFKTTYQGNFKDNQMNGLGLFYYNNGDVYEGNFVNGLKDGKAIYKWKNGCKWIGNFSQNEMDGDGLFYNEKGECFGLSYSNGKIKN